MSSVTERISPVTDHRDKGALSPGEARAALCGGLDELARSLRRARWLALIGAVTNVAWFASAVVVVVTR